MSDQERASRSVRRFNIAACCHDRHAWTDCTVGKQQLGLVGEVSPSALDTRAGRQSGAIDAEWRGGVVQWCWRAGLRVVMVHRAARYFDASGSLFRFRAQCPKVTGCCVAASIHLQPVKRVPSRIYGCLLSSPPVAGGPATPLMVPRWFSQATPPALRGAVNGVELRLSPGRSSPSRGHDDARSEQAAEQGFALPIKWQPSREIVGRHHGCRPEWRAPVEGSARTGGGRFRGID